MAVIIPRLSIGAFYKYIRVAYNGTSLPISCLENNVTRSWGLPQQPVDNNTTIGDTIWRNPITIEFNAFVSGYDLQSLNNLIEEANNDNEGLTIFTMNGVYKNMYTASMSIPEMSDMVTGALVPFSFQEVIYVNFKEVALSESEVADINDASTVTQGTKEVSLQSDSSAAKDLLDSLGVDILNIFK